MQVLQCCGKLFQRGMLQLAVPAFPTLCMLIMVVLFNGQIAAQMLLSGVLTSDAGSETVALPDAQWLANGRAVCVTTD